jgi:hypothetical protein
MVIRFGSGDDQLDIAGSTGGTMLQLHDGSDIIYFAPEANTARGSLYMYTRAAAGGSRNRNIFASDLNAMNGSDTVTELYIDVANADHTGTGNTLNLIETIAITGDANSNLNAILIGALTGTAGAASEVETAINIGAGWDYGLSILADGSATDDNITLGDSRDGVIYHDGTNLWLTSDDTAGHGIRIRSDITGTIYFDEDGGYTDVMIDPANAANAGFNIMEISATAVYATNGSDIINMLELDWNETDWATATETLNGINIDGITQDAQGTYNAIQIGAGWDKGVWHPDSVYGTYGASSDMQIGHNSGSSINIIQLNQNMPLGIYESGFSIVAKYTGQVVAGGSYNYVEFVNNGTVGIMDGSDTINALNFDVTNADHTGTGNTLNIISIDAITGDAESNLNAILIGALTGTSGSNSEREIAVNIGTGWDSDINFQDTIAEVDFNGQLQFNSDAGGSNNVQLMLKDTTNQDVFSFIGNTYGYADVVQIASAPTAMNGSDTLQALHIDYANADHSGTGNTVNLPTCV